MYAFVITSILKPRIGIYDPETRYQQTLKTIKSIKDKVPDALILLVDSSPEPLDDEWINTLRSEVSYFVSLMTHQHASDLANRGMKSAGECYSMVVALDVIRNLALTNINRVFKITGRAKLTDNFHIEDYDNPGMKGSYVFKTPVVSWMSQHLKLVDTRLWSFDHSMLDEAEQLVRYAYEETMQGRFDLEHAYYKLLPKDRLFEMPVIGLTCQLASCGTIINE